MIVFVFVCISVLYGRCLTQDVPRQDHTSTQSQIQKLSEEVEFLKSALEQLILKDKEMQSDNAKLLQRVERLEIVNAKLEKEVLRTSKTDVSSSETHVPLNSTDIIDDNSLHKDDEKSLLSADSASDQLMNWRKESSKRCVGGDPGRVAFTATFGDRDQRLNVHQTIIFDSVLTNIGGQYNSHTGIFSVNIEGVYVFFVNILCRPHEGVYTELVNDGTPISYHYCVGDDRFENGSNMVVVELPVGVSIWVRTRHVDNNDVYELSYETSFTGFLLYPN